MLFLSLIGETSDIYLSSITLFNYFLPAYIVYSYNHILSTLNTAVSYQKKKKKYIKKCIYNEMLFQCFNLDVFKFQTADW